IVDLCYVAKGLKHPSYLIGNISRQLRQILWPDILQCLAAGPAIRHSRVRMDARRQHRLTAEADDLDDLDAIDAPARGGNAGTVVKARSTACATFLDWRWWKDSQQRSGDFRVVGVDVASSEILTYRPTDHADAGIAPCPELVIARRRRARRPAKQAD